MARKKKRKVKRSLRSLTPEGQVLEAQLQDLPGFKEMDDGWLFCGDLPDVDNMKRKIAAKSCVNCKYAKKSLQDATKTCIPCLTAGRSKFKANGKGGM